jgi:5-methylcytosine-specific restriction endonuclease McrA
LGRQVSFGNVAEVLHRALESFVGELRKRKFAATSSPRKATPRKSDNPRHIPARVKREVWKRDHGRCTFVGDGGHRCDSRRDLEFDHVVPVARGGEATSSNLRLRCRTHNQLEAERLLGHALMESKRLAASFAGAGASST